MTTLLLSRDSIFGVGPGGRGALGMEATMSTVPVSTSMAGAGGEHR